MDIKLGPVRDIRYSENGEVLGWTQSILDEEGEEIGTLYPDTKLGRRNLIKRCAEKLKVKKAKEGV